VETMKRQGQWIETSTNGETVRAFLPPKLPPNPPIDLNNFTSKLDAAHLALGRLDGITSILPSPALFIFMYVRKEALLSSQIEGTQSSLSDLLLFEAHETPFAPLDDVEEVSRYVDALKFGLNRLNGGFPISLRLLREVHQVLLSSGRGAAAQPGEIRASQNWIGGTRPGNAIFVPPPPHMLPTCLSDLEKYIHEQDGMPALIKAALAHVQFETIHPFLDGNGRLGRLLIVLLLCDAKILKEPTLYLSLYFKTHRREYYELLQRVRTHGEREEWLDFFLTGVIETAESAATTAQRMLALFEKDMASFQGIGRKGPSAIALHQLFQRHPLLSAQKIKAEINVSLPTAMKTLKILEDLGMIHEVWYSAMVDFAGLGSCQRYLR
jgi:Fic family protein